MLNWQFWNHNNDTRRFCSLQIQTNIFWPFPICSKRKTVNYSSVFLPIKSSETTFNLPNSTSTFLSSLPSIKTMKAKISSHSYQNPSSKQAKVQSIVLNKLIKKPTFREKTVKFTFIPRNKLNISFNHDKMV